MVYFKGLVEYYISDKTLEEKFSLSRPNGGILSAGGHVEPLFLFFFFLLKTRHWALFYSTTSVVCYGQDMNHII